MGFISSEQLPTTVGPAKYDVVVGDARARDSASTVRTLALMLRDCGLLILGSIDDIDEETTSSRQAGSELRKLFERIALRDNEAVFPHIYAETRNKHQYAISYFSAWRKKPAERLEGGGEAETEARPRDAVEYYEDQNILNSYDIFHFGEGLLSVKNFPLRMSEVCVEACRKFNTNFDLALDAGSGPGRTAIELCAHFKQVRSPVCHD